MGARRLSALCAAMLAVGCGSRDEERAPAPARSPSGTGEAAVATEPGPAEATPSAPMGFARPEEANYVYGKGAKQVEVAERAAKARKWPAVAAACRQALAADPQHLAASYLLGVALANQGDAAAARPLLFAALTGDWLLFGPKLESDERLVGFFASPEGKAAITENHALGEQFLARARAGTLLVGRRTAFAAPRSRKGKVEWSTSRGEVFSYDHDARRYLRLTHTRESVASWLVSPSGDELAYVAYSGVQLGRSEEDPPLIARLRIGVLHLATLTATGREAKLDAPVRAVELAYGAGDELVVTTFPPEGRWGLGAARAYAVDQGAGKLEPRDAAAPDGERVQVSYVWVERIATGAPDIQAEDEASSFRLLTTQTTVELPIGELVRRDGYLWSPDKVHLLVRTLARPCDGVAEASLYLVDAATGKLKHVLRGNSLFGAAWLDNERFVYEDGEGQLRVYDVERRMQIAQLENRGGVSLTGLAANLGAVCREDRPVEPSDGEAPEGVPVEPAPTAPSGSDQDG